LRKQWQQIKTEVVDNAEKLVLQEEEGNIQQQNP